MTIHKLSLQALKLDRALRMSILYRGQEHGSCFLSEFPGCCGINVVNNIYLFGTIFSRTKRKRSLEALNLVLSYARHAHKVGLVMLTDRVTELVYGAIKTGEIIDLIKNNRDLYNVTNEAMFKNPNTGNEVKGIIVNVEAFPNHLL